MVAAFRGEVANAVVLRFFMDGSDGRRNIFARRFKLRLADRSTKCT